MNESGSSIWKAKEIETTIKIAGFVKKNGLSTVDPDNDNDNDESRQGISVTFNSTDKNDITGIGAEYRKITAAEIKMVIQINQDVAVNPDEMVLDLVIESVNTSSYEKTSDTKGDDEREKELIRREILKFIRRGIYLATSGKRIFLLENDKVESENSGNVGHNNETTILDSKTNQISLSDLSKILGLLNSHKEKVRNETSSLLKHHFKDQETIIDEQETVLH